MLIGQCKQKIIKPITPLPPVAPQIVVMKDHVATSDDKLFVNYLLSI